MWHERGREEIRKEFEGKTYRNDYLEDLVVGGIILMGWEVVDYSGSRQEQVEGHFEHSNETSGSTKCGDKLRSQ